MTENDKTRSSSAASSSDRPPPAQGPPRFVAAGGAEEHRAEYVPIEQPMADDFTRTLVLRDTEREWPTSCKFCRSSPTTLHDEEPSTRGTAS